jgi:hypothetical protein
LKFHKGDSFSTPFSRKEFQDGRFRSLPTGSSPVASTSKMAPDPLLLFLYNAPAADKTETESMQTDSSTEVSLEDEKSEVTTLERNFQLNPLSDKDQIEKARRCEFVQGLLLSTILDDSL